VAQGEHTRHLRKPSHADIFTMANTRNNGKNGRPSKYQSHFAEEAYRLCLLGATDKQIAEFFNVSERTVNNWKREYPEFFQSLKRGKIVADAEVAEALFKRACGYSHPETKVFCSDGEITERTITRYYPPDVTACIFWLKNRQPKAWRDQQDVRVTEVPPEPMTVGEVKERIAALEAAGNGLAIE
jgi:hypothetical protein